MVLLLLGYQIGDGLLVGLRAGVRLGFGDQPVFGGGHLGVVSQCDVRLPVALSVVAKRGLGVGGAAHAICALF